MTELSPTAGQADSIADSVAELKRLEVDIKGAARASKTKWSDDGDGKWRVQPARLHAIPGAPE